MNDTIKAIEVSFYDKENSLQLATDIYTTHVKPLEDALAKAEEREKVLVEALEAAKSTLNLINSKMPGGVYYKKYEPVTVAAISKACTALAAAKGGIC